VVTTQVQYLGTVAETVELPKSIKVDKKNGIERTFEGALHLTPRSVKKLGEAEIAWLKLNRTDIRFVALTTDKRQIKSKKRKPKETKRQSAGAVAMGARKPKAKFQDPKKSKSPVAVKPKTTETETSEVKGSAGDKEKDKPPVSSSKGKGK